MTVLPALLKLRLPRFAVAVEFTREGVIFLLLSLAIGAAAVNTGNNVLYFIFALMLGMVIVSGIASRRILHALTPSIHFPEHVFAGIGQLCFVSLKNNKSRIPSVAVRFVIRDPEFTNVNRYFFYVPAQEQASGYARFLFSRRGMYRLKEIELQTQFPFSFFIKVRRYFVNDIVRVYPRVYRLTEEMLARYTEGLIRESPYRGESQQLLHLRDYNSRDSSKRIHWKASAKAEKLLVKEYQKEQGRELYLYYDCFPDDPDDPIAEKALSFLASLSFLFRERGMDARVVLPGRMFDTKSSMIPLLSYLAEWQHLLPAKSDLSIAPDASDSVVLQLQSRRLPSKFGSVTPNARTIFLEDWEHLMRQEDLIEI
jgi:uncharacterized protein (DUF58 family)